MSIWEKEVLVEHDLDIFTYSLNEIDKILSKNETADIHIITGYNGFWIHKIPVTTREEFDDFIEKNIPKELW
jgi:hypothetical protein